MGDATGVRVRSHWAWGFEDQALAPPARAALSAQVGALLGVAVGERHQPLSLERANVAPARGGLDRDLPPSLAPFATSDREVRARHTYGRGFADQWRGLHGDFAAAPDLVARPRDEAEIERVLAWAAGSGAWVVPWGGGTSVVGGVEAVGGRDQAAAIVVLDLGAMDRVLEVDPVSRAARIQAGSLGPDLERALAPHGLSLRFYPQSFECSTLGGWIATRAGGHYATGPTHIDDLVESIRMVTPQGLWQSRRLPASGAGPSPDRLVLGSEGALGVITEAWMRVVERPRFRASATVQFGGLAAAVDATRAIVQAGLAPANCRLLDEREALLNMVAQGAWVLVLGFESADHAQAPAIERALELARAAGGRHEAPVVSEGADGGGGRGAGRGGAASRWRQAFLQGPYLQPALMRLGVVADTFETACTWDRFPALYAAVTEAVRDVARARAGAGEITCRFTHVYADGPAPYFTFVVPAKPGDELATWAALRAVAAETVLAQGGTITHHHAVGRLHAPWWARERPAPLGAVLAAAKAAVDPRGIMNPGVLGLGLGRP
jgi:alkyldihydroxyacetonephosphate synthase